MRKLPRMHRQTLLTDDLSDNNATHSFRVAFIGWFLAREEGADPYKVVMMCLLHDMPEARSGDHNWVHKRYVTVHEGEIVAEQLGTLPFGDLADLAREYARRESAEAVVAKDADLIDQVLLLREYEWQGNREAARWLSGAGAERGNAQMHRLQRASSKRLARAICAADPSAWWDKLWTSANRPAPAPPVAARASAPASAPGAPLP